MSWISYKSRKYKNTKALFLRHEISVLRNFFLRGRRPSRSLRKKCFCIFIILDRSKKSNSTVSGHFGALNVLFFEMFGVHSARLSNPLFFLMSHQTSVSAVADASSVDRINRLAYDHLLTTLIDIVQPVSVKQDELPWIQTLIRMLGGNRRVLDVGCGYGRHAQVFSALRVQYVGIDVSGRSLKLAQEAVSGVTFCQMSVNNMSFPREYFDGFWCFMALQHTPKRMLHHSLGSLRAVLRSGGIGVIAVPDGDEDAVRFRDFGFGITADVHISRYRGEEFAKALTESGFSIMRQVTQRFEYSDRPVHVFLVASM